MARRKAELTADELKALTERAEDLSNDIGSAAERISVTQDPFGLENIRQFNRLSEMCGTMNRMLLALQWRVEEIERIKSSVK